jgi:phage shock protein PspC (stress-responsive transcriptional regulator)
MKKNISINISGIIFHIEEDGYESLKKYLDSINKYFSTFEDSSEILADIESRIAEIFLSKLNEGKQVITADDVKSLMVTMGSVTDFKAAEEEAAASESSSTTSGSSKYEQSSSQSSSTQTSPPKRLMRDVKRKVLGGVCAGIAHYFNIDPVWSRVLFALLALGSSGAFILLYIILWIALPESGDLEDQPAVKKMYRDPETKVLGGVAAGLAAFIGADVALIRLIFVILGFFGFGILLYIIFWIALPEAKTITEKMEMQGEPVTLSNIESSVKKGINEKEGQEESTLAKIILFPFRAIAAILNGIAKILGPLFSVIIDVLRIGVGAIITMTGLMFILSLLFGFGILAGMLSTTSFPEQWNMQFFSIPVDAFKNTFPTWTVMFAFLAAFVPALVIFLLGISTIAKKIVFGSTMGWTLFVTFFVSVAFLSFSIPQIALSFKEEGEVKVEKVFAINPGTPVLKIRETGMDDYDVTNITLRGYDGKDIKLVQRFEAQGSNRKKAAENAQMVEYVIEQQDSLIYFDSNITFKKDAKFRAQRLKMDLYIPINTPFVIEDELWRLITNYPRYRHDNQTETWKFNDEELVCLTCPDYERESNDDRRPKRTISRLNLKDQYGLEGFNSLDLSGVMNVRIQRGDQFAVDLGNDSQLKERYDVYTDGETLVISYDDKRKFFWNNKFWSDADEIQIKITMPSLEDLSVTGAGKVSFKGFDESEMQIDLTGAVIAEGEVNSANMNIDITGASSLDLKGEGNFMEANITGASGLKAYGYEVEHAVVEAHGASTAKVNVTQTLEVSSGFASNVSHRGNPEIIRKR